MPESLTIEIKEGSSPKGPPPVPQYQAPAPPGPAAGGAGGFLPPPPKYQPPAPPKPPDHFAAASEFLGKAGQGTASRIVGSAGDVAAGFKAGGMMGAAAAGSAIVAIAEELKQLALAPIKAAGSVARDAAGLKGDKTIADTIQAAAGALGSGYAEAVVQIREFAAELHGTAGRLAKLNGEIAVATARANVAQILGDINRAQMLSGGLTRFTALESRFSQAGQDLSAKLLEKILPLVNDIFEKLVYAVETVEQNADALAKIGADLLAIVGGMAQGPLGLPAVAAAAGQLQADVAAIKGHVKPKEQGTADFLAELRDAANALNGRGLPAQVAGVPRAQPNLQPRNLFGPR